jgi:hypothetical protein
MSYITLAGHPPTSDILDTLHGSFVTGWNFTPKKKLLLNGLDFSSFLMFGCSSKHLVLICFSCGVLYEIFHYASNTILDPYPSLLPELERPEDRWVGDPTEKRFVVWVFCLGCFSQSASWCLQSSFFSLLL